MIDYSKINVSIDDSELYKLARKGANIILLWKGKKVILPKVLRGCREKHQKTETYLKNKGLMPIDPPIAYEFQQFNGDIFYLYDISKTKKFESTDKDKTELKKYRKDLNQRKTCHKCGKVQRLLNDLETRLLPNYEDYYSCPKCYKEKSEEIMKSKRSIKHDFKSYFINKGIDLDAPIDKSEEYDIVYLDFETTGLSSIYDEIIQVSIIDHNGRVLLYKLCKPLKNKSWDEAMNINGITPGDVENELPFENYVADISDILERSRTIVCYNCDFEMAFLDKYGVTYIPYKFGDCMLMFSEIYGEWNDYFQDYKWQKLTTAASYYGYNFEGQEHNSLADVFATKFVYERILSDS